MIHNPLSNHKQKKEVSEAEVKQFLVKPPILAALASDGGSALRSAGYSVSELRSAGYSVRELRSAGYSVSELRSAGYSASALRSTGYSVSELRSAGYSVSDLPEVPVILSPYTSLLKDIRSKARLHKQSTFGPEIEPVANVCKTPMCTAGHLVQMAGEAGWKLKEQFGFAAAASMLHFAAHPDYPHQNFSNIPDSHALAYIEWMADVESAQAKLSETSE